MFAPEAQCRGRPFADVKLQGANSDPIADSLLSFLSSVDYVPPTLAMAQGNGKLVVFEDNDPIIKMTVKGRIIINLQDFRFLGFPYKFYILINKWTP